MNGGKCGRCRGRGYVKPTIGFGDQQCPKCRGNGVTERKSALGSRTVSIPLPPGARCVVCNRPATENHHVISQSRLDRYVQPAEAAQKAKADGRNAVPLCRRCHDDGTLRLELRQLHPDFLAFVFAYDLAAALPRYLQERAA